LDFTFHHICIETDRYKESVDFYCGILDFEIIKETSNFHGRDFNAWLKKEKIYIELQTPKKQELIKYEEEKITLGIVHVCFLVEDLEWSMNRIAELGYTRFKQKDGKNIYSVEETKLCKIIAPEGTIIEFREEEI